MTHELSRRDALRVAGSLGLGALLTSHAGCASAPSASGAPNDADHKASAPPISEAEASSFLAAYSRDYQRLYTATQEAQWLSVTDVTPEHTEASVAVAKQLAQFVGEKSRLERLKQFRAAAWRLKPETKRQIDAAYLLAADSPGTIPEMVAARTEAEIRQAAAQDGFRYRMKKADGAEHVVSANDIDEILLSAKDERERLAAWESSKEIGVTLRSGLLELRKLRNACSKELGYTSFFDLRVSAYGMSVAELAALAETAMRQTRPLYEQLHCYAKHTIAQRLGKPVPRRVPAHWLPNRWGQQWPGLEESADLDPLFKTKTPEWIVHQAEAFYISMGFPKLPASFWKRSDLWELGADSKRKKNAHATAWHIDLDHDVRSLQSIKNDAEWFTTAHHELGHIYYFLSYTDAGVPVLLRDGANRAFHEAIGELISLACTQRPYLSQIGVLTKEAADADAGRWLLAQAMNGSNIVFQPFSWGVMAGWERDFYDNNLPDDQLNARWWELARLHQGIEPPTPRGEHFCDPASKTHINDTAGQYYDYAICSMIVYQLHMSIAKNILKQDPHNCSYYGRKDVGEYLRSLLSLGATRDWREVLRAYTGEDLSARAMLEYYEPLMPVMKGINARRDVSFA
jgi:peptidyl-dipeptidase A